MVTSKTTEEGKTHKKQRKEETPKRQPQISLTIELEVINQKIFAKEERDRVKQYKQNRTSQNNERTFYKQVDRVCSKTNHLPEANVTK